MMRDGLRKVCLMRWYFREVDLCIDVGLLALFEFMRPRLEYDALRCIWIMRR